MEKQGTKIPASDIDAHLKYKNVDEVKKTCEKMYHDGRIGRTGNYRYFVLTKKVIRLNMMSKRKNYWI